MFFILISGFFVHSGIFIFFGFLFFHLGHLIFAIAFPFKADYFMTEYSRIAHAVEMIIIIALGLLPGAIIVSTSKYRINDFLPELCVPTSDHLFFYTFSLPIIISATIGLAMLFTAFWIVRRVSVYCIHI